MKIKNINGHFSFIGQNTNKFYDIDNKKWIFLQIKDQFQSYNLIRSKKFKTFHIYLYFKPAQSPPASF